MKPQFEETATTARGKYSLAKVDCTTETEICKKYSVSSYPTIKVFKRNGESINYEGSRTPNSFIYFLNKISGKFISLLSSTSQIENFVDSSPVIIGYFEKESRGKIFTILLVFFFSFFVF
jgi:thioredoxin-like negative regulator of GroEL